MGRTRICICWHKYRQTIIYCLIFLASTPIFTHNVAFAAEGRTISKLIEGDQVQNQNYEVNFQAQIGSRPPKCEKRCTSCGRCEAVQVPVGPQVQSHSLAIRAKATPMIRTNSRGDDLSNYKPMSWKCKCGDYFFNP